MARLSRVRLIGRRGGCQALASRAPPAESGRSADRAQDVSRTAGTATALTGWKAQNRRCASVKRGPAFSAAAVAGARSVSGQGSPSATQRVRTSISRSFSFPLGGIFGSCS